MSIIIAYFCGLCFYTLASAIEDYIRAKVHEIEANAGMKSAEAEKLRLDNKERMKGE